MIFLPFAFATSVINKWHEGQISAIQYAVAAYGPLWWASLHKFTSTMPFYHGGAGRHFTTLFAA
jgi:hypothetical protein